LLVGALLVGACSGADQTSSVLTAEAVTLAALPDGGFLWADIDGTIHDHEGNEIAAVDAVTDGQRGLLGLTVDREGRVFVAYTDVTFDLVVSELADGSERQVWRGPKTTQGGNGGRMIIRDGELIIGIGLLNDRVGQADPTSIVGKLIAIDPAATPDDQQPRILSGPWNNPFAFDATPDGSIWVADNHPQDGDERLARGDQGIDPETALVLPADSAPSGLAATTEALFVCSYNSLQLDRYDLVEGAPIFVETIADDCVLDVDVLTDGDLIYSTGTSIVRLTP
jgi:glucose/arabinose dehydrogenase